MNFTHNYSLRDSGDCKEYFVGMNTGRGFVSKYDSIIDEKKLKRLYIIKGAAGTGKSTLMYRCAKVCKDLGHDVNYYLCSSDPDSIDCILIDDSIAILDGTSPHTLEMKYPGAVSELIDVTRFWDTNILTSRVDDIVALTEAKQRAFSDAYSLLSDLSRLAAERSESIIRAVDSEKLEKFTSRFVSSLGKGKGDGRCDEIILRAVGMKGTVRLGTLEKLAKNIISVSDVYASAYRLMRSLAEKLIKSHFDIVISPDPINPELICDIYIPQTSTLITIEESANSQKTIKMARFIDTKKLSEIRGIMRLSLKCSAALFEEAVNMFSLGGMSHFGLEKIYSTAMNFEEAGKYTEQLKNDILKLL